MNGAYQLIPLLDASPGMVLGEVLRDEKGNVLLAQGVVLTEAMLASLARHGVELLPILAAACAAPALDAAQVQQRLDRVFRKHERGNHADWATGILRQYVEDFRMKREVQR
jgi:Skp family chaperone for outer membrane proteins